MPNQYVEQRVVEMQIDNKKFESGAKKTIGTLEKLEKALKIKSDGKTFDDLERSMNNFEESTDSAAKGLEKFALGFSALEIAGMRVISNLTDSVYNFVTRTAKSLTIDQVSAGWNKYEKMIESTQTVMAATQGMIGKNIADDGTEAVLDEAGAYRTLTGELVGFLDEASQMTVVQDYLEGLLWFADETSYSFTDMVDNFGKFLSAGRNVEDSYKAMMGVASWGATAGAKPAEVSRALYNISQAMGTGSMKAIDWKSIENANMATMGFKETAMAVAMDLNKLQQVTNDVEEGFVGMGIEVDETGHIIGMTDEEVEKILITATNFRDSLSTGWFDSEVMEEVFSRYGAFAEQLRVAVDDTGLEATELLQILDKTRKQGDDFNWDKYAKDAGLSAEKLQEVIKALDEIGVMYDYSEQGFRRGQEAKTWSDALDATKDAISSRWMSTFQYIFGDYLEAKEFWTAVTGELYDLFATSADLRNDILKVWAEVDEFGRSGRDYLLGIEYDDSGEIAFQGALWNLVDAFHSILDPIREGFAEAFGIDDAETFGAILRDLTKRFQEFTANVGFSKEASASLKAVFKAIFTVLKGGLKVVSAGVSVFMMFAQKIGDLVDLLISIATIFGKVGEEIEGDFIDPLTGKLIHKRIFTLADAFAEIEERLKKIFSLSGDFNGVFKKLGNALLKLLPDDHTLANILTTAKDFVSLGWQTLVDSIQNFDITAILPSWEDIDNTFKNIKQHLKEVFPETYALLKQWRETSKLGGAFQSILDFFNAIWDSIKGITFDGEAATGAINKIAEYFSRFFGLIFGDTDEVTQKVTDFLSAVWTGILNAVSNLKPGDVFKAIKTAAIVAIMVQLGNILGSFGKILKSSNSLLEGVIDLTTGAYGVLNGFEKKLKAEAYFKIAMAFLAISAGLIALSTVPGEKLTHVAVVMGLLALAIGAILKSLSPFSQMGTGGDTGMIVGNTINVFGKLGGVLIGLAGLIGGIALLVGLAKNVKMDTFIAIMATLAILLAGIVTVVILMKKVKFEDSKGVVLSFLAIAGALNLLIPILAIMALMPGPRAFSAVLSVAGLLIALGAVVVGLEKFVKDGSKLLQATASMAILAAALNLLIPIVAFMGALPPEMFSRALASITVMLGLFTLVGLLMAVATKKLDDKVGVKMILMATSMVIMAVAINLLVPAFLSLATGLTAIAATISVMGDFGEQLKRFALLGGLLLVFAGAIALVGWGVSKLGKGMFYAGAGVLAFAVAIAILAAVIGPFAEALPKIGEGFSKLGEYWNNINWKQTLLGVGVFVLFAGTLIILLALITKLFKFDFSKFGTKAAGAGKKLYTTISTILRTFGTKLKEDLPKILPEILKALGAIMAIVGAYLLNIIPTLSSYIVVAIVSLLSSVATALAENHDALVTSITSIVTEIFSVVMDVIKTLWDQMGVPGKIISVVLLVGFAIKTLASALTGPGGIFGATNAAGEALTKPGGLISGVKETVDSVRDLKAAAELTIGSLGGLAVVGPIAAVALGLLYAGISSHNQDAKESADAHAGLTNSIEDQVVALQRLKDNYDTLHQDNLMSAEYGGTYDYANEDRRLVLYKNELKQVADALGITSDELERQMAAADGDVTKIQALIDAKAELARQELQDKGVPDDLGSDAARYEKFTKTSEAMSDAATSADSLSTSLGSIFSSLSDGSLDLEGFKTSVEDLGLSFDNLGETLTGGDIDMAAVLSTWTGMGESVGEGTGTGIDLSSVFATDAIANMDGNMIAQIIQDLGINSPSKAFSDIAAGVPEGVQEGVNNNTYLATNSVSSMASSMLKAVDGSFAESNLNTRGSNFVIGLANGVLNNLQVAYDAGFDAGEAFMQGYDDATSTKSPSREMMKRGVYAIQGLVLGLQSEEDSVYAESFGVGNEMMAALQMAMSQVALLASDNFDISPVITPIVDLSNITTASGYMNSAFSQNYGVSAQMSSSIARRLNDVERVAASVAESGAGQTINGDQITFNIYASEGMDEEQIADAVMNRLSNRMSRRGVAFG